MYGVCLLYLHMFTTNMHKVCVITDSVPDETKIGRDLQIGTGYMMNPEVGHLRLRRAGSETSHGYRNCEIELHICFFIFLKVRLITYISIYIYRSIHLNMNPLKVAECCYTANSCCS